MKKRKTHFVIGSKMALVATMMASPLVAAPESTPTPKPKANPSASASQKIIKDMGGETVTLGRDPKGHVILRNSRGETFYLESGTGKMIYVKWEAPKAPALQKK